MELVVHFEINCCCNGVVGICTINNCIICKFETFITLFAKQESNKKVGGGVRLEVESGSTVRLDETSVRLDG